MYVLRRICIANTDEEALWDVQEPLRWNREMKMRVHVCGNPVVSMPSLDDGSTAEATEGECFGSIATVAGRFEELQALGIRKVIGWFHFGNIPYERVRRSMQLMATDVIPRLS